MIHPVEEQKLQLGEIIHTIDEDCTEYSEQIVKITLNKHGRYIYESNNGIDYYNSDIGKTVLK